jgi:V/A-type H+/Na+-transporting ATPase subunit A
MEKNKNTKGVVSGIIANLVMVQVDGPVSQNEICYINLAGVRLMAEVIKVLGNVAYVQVFESTRGLKVGDSVEFEGHMLEVTLGPGILSKIMMVCSMTLIKWKAHSFAGVNILKL